MASGTIAASVKIVLVILGLGIIAVILIIPSYQGYAIRGRMSEVVLAASACRTLITERYQSGRIIPRPKGNDWGCETSKYLASKYVAAIATDANGVIFVTATDFGNPSIDGRAVVLVPYKDATTPSTTAEMPAAIFKWECGVTKVGVPLKYLPGSCRSELSYVPPRISLVK